MLEAIVGAALHAVIASFVTGAILSAIVFALVRVLALSAAARHALWTIALVATAIVPLAAFGVSAARVSVNATGSEGAAGIARSARSAPNARRAESRGMSQAMPRAAVSFALPELRPSRTIALGVVGVWALGAAIGFAGLAASLRRVRGLKRRSSPLDGALADDLPWLTEGARSEREVYLRLSYETETPVAIGFRRPVILIPTDLATANGLGEIEPLVMHENAHLQRYDDWTNVLQRAIERLFWFNPLVWIVGRRIALEREIASDEAVVARTGQAKDYANSLWRLAREMRMPENAVVAPGALLTRKQISIRIETLLSGRTPIPALGPLAALAIVGAAVLSIVAAASSAPALQLPAPGVVALKGIPAMPTSPATPATPASLAWAPAVEHPAAVPSNLPLPRSSAHVRSVNVEGSGGVGVDVDGIKRSIADLVDSSLASVPHDVARAFPRTVAQARLDRDAANTTDLATVAQILRHCVGCDMSGRNLRGIDLRGATLVGTNFADSDLRGSRLDSVAFAGVNLRGARLDGASLRNARFTGVNIEDVSLYGAKLTGLRVIGSSFADMDLRGLDVRAMLDGCVGCNLQDANLQGSDLHGIRLTGANLSGTNLRDVNLSGSQLNGTNFSGANASGATFVNASLIGCDFSGATLRGSRFDGARLDGSNLNAN
jgi:uncharacterized protein YjbI with pentapeptide repeats/beta-lactamase regulating signal transducer with metallopeptidase domain